MSPTIFWSILICELGGSTIIDGVHTLVPGIMVIVLWQVVDAVLVPPSSGDNGQGAPTPSGVGRYAEAAPARSACADGGNGRERGRGGGEGPGEG